MRVRRLEAGGGGGFGFEGGDGFDETGDGECIADAAGAADEMESATMAREGDGKFYQRGDTGAIDLRNVIEVDDHFAGALLEELLGEVVEVFAGLTDGQAAIYFEVMNPGGFARGDFQWWIKGHERSLSKASAADPGSGSAGGPCIIR